MQISCFFGFGHMEAIKRQLADNEHLSFLADNFINLQKSCKIFLFDCIFIYLIDL